MRLISVAGIKIDFNSSYLLSGGNMSMPSSSWNESLISLLKLKEKYFNSETSQLAVDTMHGGFSQMPYGLIMIQTKLGISTVIKRGTAWWINLESRGWINLDLLKDRPV
jgi:hypothetical protein